MNIKFKKWQIVAAAIFCLLVILNPSLKDFKEYSGDTDVTIKMNFLVASVFKDGNINYMGIAKNFVKLTATSATNNDQGPQYDSSATEPTEKRTFESNSMPTKRDPLVLDSTDNPVKNLK
jgi:hypothetical protein